jgi:predicted kinase
MTEIDIPELALVALVGISGLGKSTLVSRHFLPTQVLSSDFFRGLVADDENDQSASGDAFDLLHYVAGKRLAAGRLTVVDATNLQPHARAGLVAVAREHDVLRMAIVLDVPEPLAWERNRTREDRTFGRQVLGRMHRDLRRSLGQLAREGFHKIHVLRGVEEIDTVTIRYEKLFSDRRDVTGPFDIIGDVHGCRPSWRRCCTRWAGRWCATTRAARSRPSIPRGVPPSSSVTWSTAARTPPAYSGS